MKTRRTSPNRTMKLLGLAAGALGTLGAAGLGNVRAAANGPRAASPAPKAAPARAACSGQTLGSAPPAAIPANEMRPALLPIAPGGFVQGEGMDAIEQQTEPAHPVCITHGFLMMETEVTIDQFFHVVKGFADDEADMLRGEERCVGHVLPCARVPRTKDSPMAEVNFFAVLKYANFLSVAEGLTPCYRGDAQNVLWESGFACTGYRLPTEAEWEYAARAGQSTRYAGSDNADEVAWHADNAMRHAHPVKAPPLRANRFGLFGMSGNVMEWVWDFYEPYRASATPIIDPRGPDSGVDRVIRGGSYINPAQYHAVARRTQHDPPRIDAPYIGFRLVRSHRESRSEDVPLMP